VPSNGRSELNPPRSFLLVSVGSPWLSSSFSRIKLYSDNFPDILLPEGVLAEVVKIIGSPTPPVFLAPTHNLYGGLLLLVDISRPSTGHPVVEYGSETCESIVWLLSTSSPFLSPPFSSITRPGNRSKDGLGPLFRGVNLILPHSLTQILDPPVLFVGEHPIFFHRIFLPPVKDFLRYLLMQFLVDGKASVPPPSYHPDLFSSLCWTSSLIHGLYNITVPCVLALLFTRKLNTFGTDSPPPTYKNSGLQLPSIKDTSSPPFFLRSCRYLVVLRIGEVLSPFSPRPF